MIEEYLNFRFKQNRLYNSWLIDSTDTKEALCDLQNFIKNTLFTGEVDLQYHPDYMFVARGDIISGTKDICVEQIRNLQQFFYNTPSLSKYRIAIIYQADLMNLSSSNACLKLLEDTPKNSFIFLITSRGAGIISTIRSRCAKINVKLIEKDLVLGSLYLKFIRYIANHIDHKNKLDLIAEFARKNKASWGDFANIVIHLMHRMTKKSINMNIELSELEERIFSQIYDKRTSSLIDKFTNVKKIINNVIDYDLDLSAATIDLMQEIFISD